METVAAFDLSESDRVEYEGRKAALALQRALSGASSWLTTEVRDQRKCDHALLPAELPANIREKVARILQERGGKEKIPDEVVDPKAPWHQQLEQHVARLMQRMRTQPLQFRQLLLTAASEPNADCVSNTSVTSFVDARKAYRRIRRAAVALGEETFYMVRGFVRRSEVNGVLPQDAQAVRLASLYKLELRRHVTISAVMECIQQADSGIRVSSNKSRKATNSRFSVTGSTKYKRSFLRRQTKSARASGSGPGEQDSAVFARAASAPAGAGRSGQNTDSESSDKVKSVHAFKLQALERLLAKSWQGSKSGSIVSLQPVPVSPSSLSDETLAQIQERVTAFLYHRSRENYPLWDEPPLSREETARHLRTLVSTLLTTPLLQGLTIDQLLEVARAARWQVLAAGDTLCVRNTEMDSLVVVMDGSLVSATDSEANPAPVSPPLGPSVIYTAPVCLGELAMVRNTEHWPRTLIAQEPGVKVLTMPRLTFETLLHRFFNGGKAVPTSTASLLQPRRPSSSPAVIAKRLARSVRNSLTGRRPSTAAPFAAMEANIARWHEVRDEKLRDYRAGLEAEQRAAALEAFQRAMDEISSASSEEDDTVLLQYSASLRSPRKESWSRHEYYPSYNSASGEMDEHRESASEPQQDSPATEEPGATGPSTDTADQLREYYRGLSARRSVMRARFASSAPSDQMVQQSPERKPSNEHADATPAADTITTVSETTWWVEEEETEKYISSENDVTNVEGSVSEVCSLVHGHNSLASQLNNRSTAPLPPKEDLTLPLPSKSPIKSTAKSSPVRKSKQKSSKESVSTTDKNITRLSDKVEDVVAETSEFDEETSSTSPSKNDVEDERAAAVTRARRSALNSLLIRQSTATMARHSKLLDKETAQHVLIQKHFADTSAATSPNSRPQSGRPRSGNRSESNTAELNQSQSQAPLPLRADLQRRMDSVLNELQLPPKAKLDLVLKYTHADHFDQFPTAVQLWERVQTTIAKRERVMKSLWDFEMLASDPRRHFRSISTHRLREEKDRDALFYKLNQASNACLAAMDELWRCCGDTVCLGDRSYRDKMKKDYTELLYEVEQERLQIIYNGIRPHVAPAIDENTENSRDEDEKQSGRTLIKVKVPSIPRGLAPRRPLNMKDGSSPRISANYVLEHDDTVVHNNQEQGTENNEALNPKFAADGASAVQTSTRFSLATPRESIFVPVTSLQESTASEQEQPIKRVSRVTVQVQQQRQTELLALSRQLEQQQVSTPSQSNDAMHAIRQPERVFVAPVRDAKRATVRSKQQEERESLRELFQQFMKRSKI
ncbi:hypothetical protein L915_16212 [Phytophthora nicotianae]|uniref:Cyclic nucleotide-binding domain-containing protein n=1 Tax=Phytophthora nicotianae TaxID=4792 RepID=W2G3N0_PHYNI|nr:hypothetical protein L915_16212 [Phytophthora nicotianae]